MNIDEIIRKRKKVLEALEAYIDGGDLDLKLVEIYNRILTELRSDLRAVGEDEDVPDIFAEIE